MDARRYTKPVLDTTPRVRDTRRAAAGRRHRLHLPAEDVAGTTRTVSFTLSRHTEAAPPPDRAEDDQLVIVPAGEVDLATAPLLQKALLGAFDRYQRVCCDLGEVSFFSAAGISVLLVAQSRAIQAGARLSVRRPYGVTRRVLYLTGLEQLLRIDTGPPTQHRAVAG